MQTISMMAASSAVSKDSDYSGLAWITTLTASLFFFYSFIQLNIFNAIDMQLMKAFHLNAPELGQLAAMYFYANAVFLFPAGILLDRYSTKKLLLSAVLMVTLGTFIFAIASTYFFAATGRFIVGVGASFCFLSCIRLASRWFPAKRMALVTGLMVTMAMIGGLVAQTPMAYLSDFMGWRNAILIDACLGCLIFLAIFCIVQDYPPNGQGRMKADKMKLQNLGFWFSIKLVLLNPQNWLGGIYTALMNLPVFLLGALWGIHYLIQVHHVSLMQASYATTFFFVGVILGAPSFGWFSDHLGKRVLPMVIGAVLSLMVMLVLLYVPHLSLMELIVLFFLIGFATSSQVLSYPTIAELNPTTLTGTATSVVSTTIMCSGVIFQPLFGWAMNLNWDHAMQADMPVYSAANFSTAMLLMPISFVVALIITLFIKETHCKSQV